MNHRRHKGRDRDRAHARDTAPVGAGTPGAAIPTSALPRGASRGRTTESRAAPVRYRARPVKTSGLVVAIVVALVALTVVAAVALAAAFGPGGGGGKAAPSNAAGPASGSSPTHAAAAASAATTSTAATKPSVTIVSGGDTMGDRGVKSYLAAHGADAVFAGIAPVLRAADAAWVNLESPLTTISDPYPGKDVHFQGDPRLAAGLAHAGVDVVNMANNHAVDQGRAGLLDSIRRVEAAGVKVVGAGKNASAARAPAIVRAGNGATIGFLGWTDIIWPGYAAGSGPGVATARPDMRLVTQAVRRLKHRVDYVVVCFHWGVEYTAMPIADQVSEAHAAIDAGADLVIGHHPHVLQGAQLYKGHFIIYSLGDLVFDHYSLATGQTVLVHAVLSPHGVKVTLIPVYASASGIPAIVTGAAGRAILLHMQRISAPLGTHLTIAGDRAYVQSPGA
jgi:poly-gamma-glutamate capsule biosynthesis protein CapA/YwtB (metallophosphatase superfamily)